MPGDKNSFWRGVKKAREKLPITDRTPIPQNKNNGNSKFLLSGENDGKEFFSRSPFWHCAKNCAADFVYIDTILFCGRIKEKQILADIISDEWPESLYHDALVMTIGKVPFSPIGSILGKQTGQVCFFVFI